MQIYLDNAATTRVSDEVFREMTPYFKNKYGNASSLHDFGQEANNSIENAITWDNNEI